MSGERDERDEPTQTTPVGEERESLGLPGEGGTTIPVPDRDDVMVALRKVAKTTPPVHERPTIPDR